MDSDRGTKLFQALWDKTKYDQNIWLKGMYMLIKSIGYDHFYVHVLTPEYIPVFVESNKHELLHGSEAFLWYLQLLVLLKHGNGTEHIKPCCEKISMLGLKRAAFLTLSETYIACVKLNTVQNE